MKSTPITRKLAASPLAPLLAFTVRFKDSLIWGTKYFTSQFRWLFSTREHTNYSFGLTPMNRIYMAHWVANIVGQSPATCLKWFDELENDQDLRMAIREAVSSSPRRRIMDSEVEFGRRLAWYALVRSLKPRHVVETGTDRGLGTLVLASALIRNGLGAVTTIDTNPDSGDLIVDPWDRVISRRVGDSIEILSELKNIDLFIHDSDHSYGHEMNEFVAISQNLTDQSMVLSDNSQSETALLDWSSGEGRRFSYFVEEPNQFWAKGGAIGIAIPR